HVPVVAGAGVGLPDAQPGHHLLRGAGGPLPGPRRALEESAGERAAARARLRLRGRADAGAGAGAGGGQGVHLLPVLRREGAVTAARFLCGSRSDVFWALAAFAALNAGLALAIPRWLPELRDPAYAYKARRLLRRAAAGPRQPLTVVMLGTSRTAYGLDGKRLEGRYAADLGRPVVVFNLGIPGGGAVTELITLRRLLAAGLRPDHLLVEVIPAFLAGQPGAPREVQRLAPARLGAGELRLVRRFGMRAEALYRPWCESWLVPWYAQRFNIVSRVAP